MASIFKRGKTWWISYYANGRQYRESLKTTNKKIAEREKQAREAKLLDPHRQAPVDINPTIADFWKRYEEWAKQHKQPRSHERTALSWRHLVDMAEPVRLGDITRDTIEDFKRKRLKDKAKPQTINNDVKDVQAIIGRAIKEGWYTGANPVVGVERFKIQRKMPEFHTEEELTRLLECAEKKNRNALWVVLLGGWAGLRRNEIIHAKWDWFVFDSDAPTIHVKGDEDFHVKDHEDRIIPMSQRIRDVLEPHAGEGYLFETAPWTEGKHHYRFDPKKSLMAALKDAGLTEKAPFQRLRHTFGSMLVQKGVGIFKVSKWMGHSSVSVTERHYAGIEAYDPEIDVF